MLFEYISHLELCGTFCSAQRNHLCISVIFYSEFGPVKWFKRRCHFEIFLSRALVVILFGGAKPFKPFV